MRVPTPPEPVPVVPRSRKSLCADALLRSVKDTFEDIPDDRTETVKIPLADALMAAFAMFSLKDPSLLAFDGRRLRCDPNLHTIYHIGQVPSDTQMRAICDPVAPDLLRPAFRGVFRALQRGKALEDFAVLDGHYLVALDGTGYYSSAKLGNSACLTKVNKKTGEVTYHLQMLGACLVHPDQPEVIPLFPEMITNGDGATKNDCERNAAKRWLQTFRQDHPHLPVIITEDALSPNAPHIRDLQAHHCRFILGVKPGDHTFLFAAVENACLRGEASDYAMVDPNQPAITHRFRYTQAMPLNASNAKLTVNFVEYWEEGPEKTQHFTWVTDLPVTQDTVYRIMRCGRARWRIENETFNTLKNQGYHFKHNFGLGEKNLALVFATLMMLAFLVDQTQQHCCKLFQAVCRKLRSKRALWETLRAAFYFFLFSSMADLHRALLLGIQRNRPELLVDTS